MASIRTFLIADVRNKNIIKDDLLDWAGVLYLMSEEDKMKMTFQDYYNNYFNSEFIYQSWKYCKF